MDKLEGRKQELFALGCYIDDQWIRFKHHDWPVCSLSDLKYKTEKDWNSMLEEVKTEYEKHLRKENNEVF